MTGTQLYLAIGAPMLFNAVLTGILIAYVNATRDALRAETGTLHGQMSTLRDQINQRFDDLRAVTLAELHRVEGVLDARLKHLEAERH